MSVCVCVYVCAEHDLVEVLKLGLYEALLVLHLLGP